MDQRQEELLLHIVKEYIRSSEPISSGFLVEKCKLPYSSATIRNEMAKLEEAGYIFQPHTSAGRIPTMRAYKLYVEHMDRSKKVSARELRQLEEIAIVKSDEDALRQTAKALAASSSLAVFWAFHQRNLYYTGISNLLSQPEFVENQRFIDVSRVIDQMEDIIDRVYRQLPFETSILIGDDNPFGAVCSSVITKYRAAKGDGMFGIIGPLRMDYEKCKSLVDYVKEKL